MAKTIFANGATDNEGGVFHYLFFSLKNFFLKRGLRFPMIHLK